jgi:alpha-tubulin suppressor-like RCC1 family protein
VATYRETVLITVALLRRSTLRASVLLALCLSCGRTERNPSARPDVNGQAGNGSGGSSFAGDGGEGGDGGTGRAGKPARGGAPLADGGDDGAGYAGNGGEKEDSGGAPGGFCGDGIDGPNVHHVDLCDDGNQDDRDECTNACEWARCGDGIIWRDHEVRDDGVERLGDSCGTACNAAVAPAYSVLQLAAGLLHTCALLDNGTVKCWGNNEQGGLGLCSFANRGDEAGEVSADLPIVDLGEPAVAISAGDMHTCAILRDGGVKCWGGNDQGQLGVEDPYWHGSQPEELGEHLPRVKLGTGKKAVAISASAFFTCALLDDGGVKCWGSNLHGQLALGNYLPRGQNIGDMGDALPEIDFGTGRTAVAVTTARNGFACAILDDGSVKCWGENFYGELGLGNNETRGDEAGEMGDALPPVKLGTGRRAIAIASGYVHTCAILDDHSVRCWGLSERGAIGQGLVFTRGNNGDAMGDTLPAIELGTKRTAKSIAAGEQRTCAILDDDTLKCWGDNNDGGLGLGNRASHGWLENQMGDQLPTVDLGAGHHALQVVTGSVHTCALLENHRVKCWGGNMAGNLGRGDGFPTDQSIGDEPGEMGDALPYVELF